MGCSCSDLFKRNSTIRRRRSRYYFHGLSFAKTDIIEIDIYFTKIKQRSNEIIPKLLALQYAKSILYHKLCLTSLFIEPNSNFAMIALVLYLIISGNKIEFIDACPYLEVYTHIEIFALYLRYVELLHENICDLTEIIPEIEGHIIKGDEYLRNISKIADEEGCDLCKKLNTIAILINNLKEL